jgi:hypothetical protein
MEMTLPGMVMEVREVQWSNVPSPMEIIPSGMLTEVREVQA